MKYLHKFTSENDFKAEYEGEDYKKPWVSLTKNEYMVKNFKVACSSSYFFGAEYIGEEEDFPGIHKWRSYYITYTPNTDTYWTTSRNPEVGDPVYCSLSGATGNTPCAVVDEILSVYGDHVDYNRSPWFGYGLVFDGADTKGDSWNGTTLRLLYADPGLVRLVEPNPYKGYVEEGTEIYAYGIDRDRSDIFEKREPITVTIVNAKALYSGFTEDQVDILLGYHREWSCSYEWSNNPISDNPEHPYNLEIFLGYCGPYGFSIDLWFGVVGQ